MALAIPLAVLVVAYVELLDRQGWLFQPFEDPSVGYFISVGRLAIATGTVATALLFSAPRVRRVVPPGVMVLLGPICAGPLGGLLCGAMVLVADVIRAGLGIELDYALVDQLGLDFMIGVLGAPLHAVVGLQFACMNYLQLVPPSVLGILLISRSWNSGKRPVSVPKTPSAP